LEHGKDENHLVEERIHSMVDGWKISGAVDLQVVDDQGGISIRDYKTTSVWAVMNEKIEWEQQLNIYAWLVDTVKEDFHVTDLGIVAIIRDWSRRDAARNPDYPQAPVKELPIKLWPYEERKEFVQSRITSHSACEFAMETGEDLPPCTPEEMWEKPTTWAIKKVGGVRAKSVHDTEESMLKALEIAGPAYEIEVRPGSRTRCESFCPVNTYCQQWRDYQESKDGTRQDLILKFMLALASNSQIFLDSDQSELTSPRRQTSFTVQQMLWLSVSTGLCKPWEPTTIRWVEATMLNSLSSPGITSSLTTWGSWRATSSSTSVGTSTKTELMTWEKHFTI
jgi:hypothetical protein